MIRFLALSIIAIFAFTETQAQDYQLNFAGSGSSTTIETIEVTNLTQGTSLTLDGSDILHLLLIVGINNQQQTNFEGLTIYPNPTSEITNIVFPMKNSGKAHLELFDVSGKNIASQQTYLAAGFNSFEIGNLHAGLYNLVIKSEDGLFSGKIVSNNPKNGIVNISAKPIEKAGYKSGSSIVQMQYNDGDLLLFKAFSGSCISILTLIPTQSATVTFSFIAATDFDGNNYGTLIIGSQIWLSENMKTTHYPDGTPIPNITNPNEWGALGDNNTDDAYCWYLNDENYYKNLYGALYTYAAATNGDNSGTNVQGVCPDGWHVPNDAEWTDLKNFLALQGFSGNEGIAIKATDGWFNPGNGTNNYGFSGLPSGYRNYLDGTFDSETLYGYMWSATESGDEYAWDRYLSFSYTNIGRYLCNKSIGISVRCLKD